MKEWQVPKQLSIPSQAFQLFEEGKILVEVAVILDIPKEEIIKIFLDYLALKNLNRVAVVLKANIKNLSVFIKWFNYINENNVKKSDVDRSIANVMDIKSLTQQKENLEKEIQSIEEERDRCLRHYQYIKREINRELY